MNKKYYFAIIPFLLGITCFVAFNAIGSKIATDGTLVEPFALIPIGYFLIAIGIITAVIISGIALFNKPLKLDKWIFGLSLGFIALASSYLFVSMSYLSERARIEISQPIQKNNNTPLTQKEKFVKGSLLTEEEVTPERKPSIYACVGEYCDGSMSGESDLLTVLQIPLVTSGGKIGCGSKIFLSPYAVPKTSAVLDATYKMLFDIKAESEIKADDIRNPIANYTKLFYKSVSIDNGVAKVMLTGNMYGPGHCSFPEIREQINQAAFQFAAVNKIEVYLNGTIFDWCSVSDADASESKCYVTPRYWTDYKNKQSEIKLRL